MGKKSIVFSLLLSASVFLTISCGGGGGGSTPPPAPTTGTLRLHNSSTVYIDYFYLSPANQLLWGPDQLSSSLGAGFYTDIVNVPPNSYDAKAKAIGYYSTYYAYLYNFTITAGNTFNLYAVDSSFTGSMKITNTTAAANITQLYVSPSSSTTWGPNQISANIGPAGYKHLTNMPADYYDVRVVWDSGPDTIDKANPVSSLTLTTLSVY